ncbi:MAG: DUF1835 domain-containing protein [Myxococcota bacterium]
MNQDPVGGAPSFDPEQLRGDVRRFAKLLLRQLKEGDAWATERLAQFHPRAQEVAAKPQLADAQLVVARILGYRSWPQLKHHRELLARAQREIDDGAPPPDGELRTVHIRCGSDIQTGLTRAGSVGSFVEFSDPLCQGPVIGGSQAEQIRTRASFIAEAYETPLAEATDRLGAQYAALSTASQFERAVLWFEHDSYDQLILAAVLAQLSRRAPSTLELICIDEYPGAPTFRGLGELREASLRGLWPQRRPVTDADFALGEAVFAALRRPDPSALWTLVATGTPAIPPMARALRRHLQELPWTTDGLSLTQRLLLEVTAAGAQPAGAIFRAFTKTDPLPFAGDAMVWWEMRELAAGGALTLTPTDDAWPRWGLAVTELGEAILAGRVDWVAAGARNRWVGGVPCGPGHPPWRWDPAQHRPARA